MKLKIKPCLIAEKDHKRELRNYAHYGHKNNIICVSKAIYNLPLEHSLALILHEVGHHLMNGGTEEEANKEVERWFGISIRYIPKTSWGNRLQFIKSEDLETIYEMLTTVIDGSSLRSFQP